MELKILLMLATLIACVTDIKGCTMDGANWGTPQTISILDTTRGTLFSRTTSDVQSLNSVTHGEDLNAGPYVTVSYENSQFEISTNDAYESYEELETAQTMGVTVTFSCTNGNVVFLIFIISVQDTNNNSPQFIPTNELDFTVMPPLPPGYLITGCLNEIVVRDIDLTTQRIDFAIIGNSDFEIEYDADSSTTSKEFKAVLRTTTFIRTIPESIVLEISATDVDLTGDPALTTYATITVHSDNEFEIPEEPVFSQAIYSADYSADHQLIMQDTISLIQGYSDEVHFSLTGVYSDNFDLDLGNNQVSLTVTSELSADVLELDSILLVIHATREFTSGAVATIAIHLPKVDILGFEQALYEGRIVDNTLELSGLVLLQGYEDETITVSFITDYAAYFNAVINENTITVIMFPLETSIIDGNNFINMQVIASTGSSTATTAVTLEIVKDDSVTPVFERTIYLGSYDTNTGLNLQDIVISQGYDETVTLDLTGEYSEYFTYTTGSVISLSVSSQLPIEDIQESQILLSLEASKPLTVGGNTVISISLPGARSLGFESQSYKGIIQDNILTHEPILLNTGYDYDVQFYLFGGDSEYFTTSNIENQVTIDLYGSLPENVINDNNILTVHVGAFGVTTLNTSTTVVFEIIKDDTETPVFSQNIYNGIYSGPQALAIEDISLIQGYDDTVTFNIIGEHASYFTFSQSDHNVLIILQSSIPEELIFTEKKLLFQIEAIKPYTVGAISVITIDFPEELINPTVMSFAQRTYIGSIEENNLIIDDIILANGFATGTAFELIGVYSSYFTLSDTDNVLHITLTNDLPEAIYGNKFIILEIEASRERAVSTTTTIVIEVITAEIIPPVFSESFYKGLYAEESSSIQLEDTITLLQGYDDTVTFYLEHDYAAWFSLVDNENTVSLIVNNIPENVIESNDHLMFTIYANKLDIITARAAIFIDLGKDDAYRSLRFTQDFYMGSIDEGILSLESITFEDDYSEDISITLTGDHENYFQLIDENGVFSIQMSPDIPDEILNTNNVLVLTLQAEVENVRTHAAIVFEIIRNLDTNDIQFEETYYTGTYAEGELNINQEIQVIQQNEELITFALSGDDSQYFDIVQNGNSVTLTLLNPIPAGVVAANHQLIFIITASSGMVTARATILILLTDEYTETTILTFDRVNYVGSIDNEDLVIQPITLIEGFSDTVTFSLIGEYQSYFNVVWNTEGVVTLSLNSAIPDDALPSNGLIVLELQASAAGTVPTYATIVLEVIRVDSEDDVVTPVFSETYYTGRYTESELIELDQTIYLSQGFDEDVAFAVEGDDSQYFTIAQNGNSITFDLSSPIPPGVVTNNQQLIFVLTATSGTVTARATIVILLTDEFTDTTTLAFDRVNYVGSIDNEDLVIQPITLTEGFSDAVTFNLLGEYQSYFNVMWNTEGVVTLSLNSAIPDDALPSNDLIVLELQASADGTIPTYATIVLEVIRADSEDDVVTPVFSETYYTGRYTESELIELDQTIYLSQGFDEDVAFAVEGDDSQYFTIAQDGNLITFDLSSPIPPGVVTNNQQLIFVLTATSGSVTARATIVILLTDEYTDTTTLAFDRVNYVGSIDNEDLVIQPITLTEGFSDAVTFNLLGEYQSYFNVMWNTKGVVTLSLNSAIPDDALPSNGLIVLELQASAAGTVPTYATIVFEVRRADSEDDVVTPVFSETYYTGRYTESELIELDQTIYLSQGFDEDVSFAVEGDDSQYFTVAQDGNSITFDLSSPIPPGVVTNNQQLIFVLTATSGTVTARATIVILLTDEYTDTTTLAFDRINYVGSIDNEDLVIQPITLTEGFSDAVTFNLLGEYQSYFNVVWNTEGVVTLSLNSAIPDDALPSNGLIVLELQASAAGTVPTYATIVFEVRRADSEDDVVTPVFSETYYTGRYTESELIELDQTIYLSQGFDEDVSFAVEGDDSQYFTVAQDGNSITFDLSSPIPPGVVTNNQQLIFVLTATSGTVTARATIVILLTDEYTDTTTLAFDRINYVGSIDNEDLVIQPITLTEGFSDAVTFNLLGEYQSYFNVVWNTEGVVTLSLNSAIPDDALPSNGLIVLELQASAAGTVPTYATIVFEVRRADSEDDKVTPVFSETYYTGRYTESELIELDQTIYLSQGFDEDVSFAVEGDDSQYFTVAQDGNSITFDLSSPIPPGVVTNNQQLIFVLTATSGTVTARATIVILLTDEYTVTTTLAFDRINYVGSIDNEDLVIQPITLTEGFSDAVTFNLLGEYQSYFNVVWNTEGVVTLSLNSAIPDDALPSNGLIVLELQASAAGTVPTYATIVFEVRRADSEDDKVTPVFSETYYTGRYTESELIELDQTIYLSQGFDEDVSFAVEGDDSQYFTVAQDGDSITFDLSSPIPPGVVTNNQQLIFVLTATSGTVTARATIVILLTDEYTDTTTLAFDRINYVGSIDNEDLVIQPITLTEGFSDAVTFNLLGEYQSYFNVVWNTEGVVTLSLNSAIPDDALPSNGLIVLELQASAAGTVPTYATIVFEVRRADSEDDVVTPVFSETYYTGRYTESELIELDQTIYLSLGFDEDVAFAVEGDNSEYFSVAQDGNSITFDLSSPIPPGVVTNNQQLIFVLTATSGSVTARATIIILLTNGESELNLEEFDKIIYEGIIQVDAVSHEIITLLRYTGDSIYIEGVYSELFTASIADNTVTVTAAGSLAFPEGISFAILVLQAGEASSVLVLNIVDTDTPVLPSVTFSSPLYVLNVDTVQTGVVGQVQAVADNGESVTYSLDINDEHLQERVSVNNEGEIHLSAPANIGEFSFQVRATTVFTQVTATATVQLKVEDSTICVNDDIVIPPLIIKDADEEEPHLNLVSSPHEGCSYSIRNVWPVDQSWLYVDENGLHTTAIDREHESIAFMALSQVQVELILHCESDASRSKRSTNIQTRLDWLGPYDYGTSKWILTDSIEYNSRRSLVNLIVNDINDNDPIFISKENEPIAVGYPNSELRELIMPRSLAELTATDADVGINAELVYWSSDPTLAVSPATGFVHIREAEELEDYYETTVHATDENGIGRTGSINLMVRILNSNEIAVVTVRDAFLDNEAYIIANLSSAVGYDVKVLNSVVIADSEESDIAIRNKRQTSSAGAILQIYVYGLIERDPVSAERLILDIESNNIASVNIVNTLSLEDHLENIQICPVPGRDTGLLVSTIILAILLFILIVAIVVWFVLKWRKEHNYSEFSDERSLASQAISEDIPKPDTLTRPRLDILELKRSERRLQEMLDAPIEDTAASSTRNLNDTIVNIPTDNNPIVIQSIDKLKRGDETEDEDEFGEVKKPRRKSVVTFNENVEKIIHVEDALDNTPPEYEVYKL